MSETVIGAQSLSKWYDLGSSAVEATKSGTLVKNTISRALGALRRRDPNRFFAIQDLSFEIARNQVVGIIGNNGAGKSTLLKILSRITEPSLGTVEIRGRVGSLLEVGTGFHPELSGRENIFLNGAIIGMRRADIRRKFDEIVEFAGIEAFLDTPVKRYSSGMYMRLAFSVAAHLDPDILIVDEVLAVGDAVFQKKCLGKLQDVGSQRTVLFVSHNLQAVQSLCNRVMHLDHGHVVAFGETRTVVGHYLSQGTSQESAQLFGDGGPGNRQICLTRFAVQSRGLAQGIYSSSKPISVEIEFQTFGSAGNMTVGFDLLTAEGVLILGSSQTNADGLARAQAEPRQHKWTCSLPPGLLNAGVYQVSAKVKDEAGHWIVNGEAVISFEVVLDHGVSAYWNSLDSSSRPGIVAPILNWHAVPVEDGVCGSAGAHF
jgi:lipopolysaccharide transport system ATP-binding protein